MADVLLEPSIQRPKYKKNSLKNQLLNFFHFYGDSEKEILKSFFKAYYTWKQKSLQNLDVNNYGIPQKKSWLQYVCIWTTDIKCLCIVLNGCKVASCPFSGRSVFILMFFLSPVLVSFLPVVQHPSSGVGAELGKSLLSEGWDVWEGLLTTASSSAWSRKAYLVERSWRARFRQKWLCPGSFRRGLCSHLHLLPKVAARSFMQSEHVGSLFLVAYHTLPHLQGVAVFGLIFQATKRCSQLLQNQVYIMLF